jgi:hypothetical protein
MPEKEAWQRRSIHQAVNDVRGHPMIAAGAFVVTSLVFAVVGGVTVAPESAGILRRILWSLVGGVGGVCTVSVVFLAYALVGAPYRQRNAARAAFRQHMEGQHRGELTLAICGPTEFRRFDPEGGIEKGYPMLLVEVYIPLIYNSSARPWSLKFWLHGCVGDRYIEIDNRRWRWVWDRFPIYRQQYASNPRDVGREDVIERGVPFLIPYEGNEDLVGKRLDNPRLVIRDLRSRSKQMVVMLPATEADQTERIWPEAEASSD